MSQDMHRAKLDIQNRKFGGKAGGNVIACPCGYRHVYPATARIAFLLEQCELHDQMETMRDGRAERLERLAGQGRATAARTASNLRYESN